MSRFHTTERLGVVQSTTPEGFLVCEGVPVARTGTMPYADGELQGLRAGKDGMVWVTRDEAALFDEAAVRSFEGKDVVLLHPAGEFVTAKNWRKYAVGHVQHVRRGTGDQAHLMVADLLVKDADAIQAVRERRIRDVSCGYDADYEQLEPGRARQVRIVGNHVALVPEGRCGPTCSIGDSAVSIRTLIERLRSAHANKDDSLFTTTLGEVEAAAAGSGGGTAGSSPVAVHVHTGDRGTEPAASGGAKPPAADDFQQKTTDALAGISTALTSMGERLTALDTEIRAIKETKPAATSTTATGDGTATKDSAALKDSFSDLVSRAEMLMPGVKAPTFDAALPAATTDKTMCDFRRQVLQAAMLGGPSRAFVEPVLTPGSDLSTMTCDGIAHVFRAASEVAKISNNRRGAAAGSPGGGDTGPVRPPTPAEMNEINRKFWARQNGTAIPA